MFYVMDANITIDITEVLLDVLFIIAAVTLKLKLRLTLKDIVHV